MLGESWYLSVKGAFLRIRKFDSSVKCNLLAFWAHEVHESGTGGAKARAAKSATLEHFGKAWFGSENQLSSLSSSRLDRFLENPQTSTKRTKRIMSGFFRVSEKQLLTAKVAQAEISS